MNIVEARNRIKELVALDGSPNKWIIGMEEVGDYHHITTLLKVQDNMDCNNWKVRDLLYYMERVSAQIERDE